MPSLSVDAVRERLTRDVPGTLVPAVAPNGDTLPDGHKPGEDRPNFLATHDLVINAERIVAAALYLRDTLGYAYLSDIALVDYLEDNLFELVYRFYHPEGGSGLVLKVRVARDEPEVPALTPHWPGANFHEREAYDLFGVNFVGHPFLKRIYMWDEFEGYPMRKDFPKQGDKYFDEA